MALAGSLVLLGLALRSLPLGTAYAIRTGIGALGTAIFGMAGLGEPAAMRRGGIVPVGDRDGTDEALSLKPGPSQQVVGLRWPEERGGDLGCVLQPGGPGGRLQDAKGRVAEGRFVERRLLGRRWGGGGYRRRRNGQ